MAKEKCVGFIQLVYFGHESGEVLTLGGAGFVSKKEDDAAWDGVPKASVNTDFMADRMDASRNIVDDKLVTAPIVERLLGQPTKKLIDAAWKRREGKHLERHVWSHGERIKTQKCRVVHA
jgi:hypothetical protein